MGGSLFKHGPPVEMDLPDRATRESPLEGFPANFDEWLAQAIMRENAKDFPHTEPFREVHMRRNQRDPGHMGS